MISVTSPRAVEPLLAPRLNTHTPHKIMSIVSPSPSLYNQTINLANANANPNHHNPQFTLLRSLRLSLSVSINSGSQIPYSPSSSCARIHALKLPLDLLRPLLASAVVFFGLGICAFPVAASTTHIPPANIVNCETLVEEKENDGLGKCENVENIADREMDAQFENWKSKTYALTVPLKIVALRGSVPPLWIKDFMRSQGRRARLRSEFRGSLEDIFSELCMTFKKGKINSRSALAADIVTLGDSWLSFAVNNALIEPIQGVENQDWFGDLTDKWKLHLCRNTDGKLDSEGRIWAAPYRWGSMVIAYNKLKFEKHNFAPIEDWADLWRPELAGKISMVDSPREVVGAVLKCMGASYNTNNIDSQVAGGRNAVQQKLALFAKQVRLFDGVHYLKALGVGDVWVAVGWSSDVIPAAKRMSNVAVMVPKSGSSLWADLWAIPASSRFATDQIGGRVRGPSPLVHQWIEFCMQSERVHPFKEAIIPGAIPFSLENGPVEEFEELNTGKPKLDTNLIAGVPPPEILARCEFLEPLSDAALLDYQWLIASTQKPGHGLIQRVQRYILAVYSNLFGHS